MKGLEMVKCESLRINMFRVTHTGKSVDFPVTINMFQERVPRGLVFQQDNL